MYIEALRVKEVAVLPTAPKMDSWLGLYILSLNPPAASDIRDEQLGLNDQVITIVDACNQRLLITPGAPFSVAR